MAEDADALLELARGFELEAPSLGLLLPGPVDCNRVRLVFEVVREHGTCLIAEEQGVPMGFLALSALPHPFTGQITADEIAWWVRREARGRTGLALLEAAERWARASGLTQLRVSAPVNSGVGRLLERKGFIAREVAYIKEAA